MSEVVAEALTVLSLVLCYYRLPLSREIWIEREREKECVEYRETGLEKNRERNN